MFHRMRKMLAAAAAAAMLSSLVFGAGAPAASAAEETLLNTTFPDVVANHWAKPHIAKMAAARVIRGYSDGTFQPNRPVTQEEAILMVLRMMGYKDEEVPDPGSVDIGLEVGGYFKKFIVKALDEQIIYYGEETLAASQSDVPWGSREATREWIAKLIVRSLGESPASGALTFADANEVASDAAGYVLKSHLLGIVNGHPDGTFRPKDSVTRAQLVTILSRAESYYPKDESKVAQGIVTNRTDEEVSVVLGDGSPANFRLNAETVVYDKEWNAMGLEHVTPMTEVRIIHAGGHAYYIELTSESAELETIEGTLTAVDDEEKTIVIENEDGLFPYQLDESVSMTDAGGTPVAWSQLTNGSLVRLKRMPATGGIVSLVLVEAAFHDEGAGIVQRVDAAERKLSFTNSAGAVVTYPVAEDAALSIKGEPIANLSEIQEGDTFEYTIRSGVIVSINVTVQKYVTVTGEFQYVVNDQITIKTGVTDFITRYLTASPTVVIEGMTNATVDDLQMGDMVQLRISGTSNRVDRVTVTNRNVTAMKATFDQMAEDFILVKDSAGKTQFFRLSNRTQFFVDGTPFNKEQFNMYLVKGRKVTLHHSADQLTRMEIVTKHVGTITQINTTARTIAIRTDDGEEIKLPLATYVAVEIPQQTNAGLADVVAGTRAQLNLGATTDEVVSIQVARSFVYTLNDVSLQSRIIYVKPDLGSVQQVALGSEGKVLDKTGKAIELSALAPGQPVILNYMGRNLASVQQAETVLGFVSMLDVSGGRMAVTDFNNQVKQYPLSGGISVRKGASVSSQPSVLKLNDRVLLIADPQGKLHVKVAEMQVRKFSSYDANKNEIALKIAKIGDQSKYALDSGVYIHAADGTPLAMNRLKENDELTIYLLDDKIIEIIKS